MTLGGSQIATVAAFGSKGAVIEFEGRDDLMAWYAACEMVTRIIVDT